MFGLKKAQPTDFEMRNPEAGRNYAHRENNKAAIRFLAFTIITATAIGVGTYFGTKLSDNIPFED